MRLTSSSVSLLKGELTRISRWLAMVRCSMLALMMSLSSRRQRILMIDERRSGRMLRKSTERLSK